MSNASDGHLDILNVGHGHLKFRFDKNDAGEIAKAKKVITDMLGRGYMLFIEIDGQQKRVRQFDPAQEEYILEEPDVIPAPPVEQDEPVAKRRRGRPPGLRVPMRQGKATAIGPSAGG